MLLGNFRLFQLLHIENIAEEETPVEETHFFLKMMLVLYKPYGEVIKTQSNGPDSFRHKYTGHKFDAESSLTYMKSRYYDGYLGRFLTVDVAIDPNVGQV